MKIILTNLFKLISYIPFVKYLLRWFYFEGLNRLKNQYINDPDVLDILLTSQLDSKSFHYGISDFNILIIVSNDCHPKKVLSEIREFIITHKQLELIINSTYIPILAENEFKTETIKSYLLRKAPKNGLTWRSIFTQKKYQFDLKRQDQFAIVHNAIQSIDYFFLKEHKFELTRNMFKNISSSIKVLNRFYGNYFYSSPKLIQISKILQKFFFLKTILKSTFIKESWRSLAHESLRAKQKGQYQELPLPEKLKQHLLGILSYNVIDDITITPTLIQMDPEHFCGKIFIDVHLNSNICIKNYYKHLEELKIYIKQFETEEMKLRIRFTTSALYKIQNELAYYPFPLEGLFRKKKTISLENYDYDFLIDYDHIILSSIHFLTGQFMRFRSLRQRTDLIGSKFMKSLNLMYKYYLITKFLKGHEFEIESDEKKIRECFTPQFSEIALDDIVTEEHWNIIRAQLQYFLKHIREELIKYDPGLKVLRF